MSDDENKKSGKYITDVSEEDMRFLYIDDAVKKSWPRELIDLEHHIVFDKGEIIPNNETGKKERGKKKVRPDYILLFDRNVPTNPTIAAFVEAKEPELPYDHGIDQAKKYAEIQNVKFAYSTNGHEINPDTNWGIREFDYTKIGKEGGGYDTRGTFPTPDELKQRLRESGFGDKLSLYLKPHTMKQGQFELRYYQRAAVDAAIEDIIKGKKRILLNLATGTGKTKIAYHIARKFWEEDLDPNGNHPKFLFITDRNQLVDQAMEGAFSAFDKDLMKRLKGKKTTAQDIYFTLYQSLDVDKEDPEEPLEEYELYKQYDKNFFKYIIIDECHRGAQSKGGKWREILNYFDSAVHIGMTATPKADADSIETFEYFGDPSYVYSEKQGVRDGFLAPHYLIRVSLSVDREGWRPEYEGQLGRNNQPLEDRLYQQNDFDSKIKLVSRQRKVAQRILEFLNTPPNTKYDKTILFCRDQQHANEMTQMILSESKEKNQNYCVQITSNQGEDGKQQLKKFCNVKEKFPVIAVTSKLMTTGVDAEMCKLIVLDTNVNSKTELKQIIGRGTRVYDNSKEMDKHYFTIMDFRQSTTSLEEDDWDSPVVAEDKEEETEKGEIVPIEHKKFRRPEVEGDEVSVITEVTKILDADSKTGYNYVEIKELMKTTIRTLGGEAIEDFKNLWLDLDKRHKLISQFESKGVSVDNIRQMENLTQDKYDLFDLFVKIAYDEKPKLRKIRAEQAKKDKIFFEKYPTKAQDVLNILLDHYAEYGYTQLEEPRKVLQLNKFEKLGGYKTILTQIFEEPEKFDDALKEIMIRVYK